MRKDLREEYDTPLQIDLDGILRARLPGRRIPRAATRLLERIVCQDRLNELLRLAFPMKGSAFSHAILDELGIELRVEGLERLPEGRRYIFASNHPLGGLDGIALIKVLGERYGDEQVKFLVNDMLMHVRPLKDVFLPINKYGSQGRAAAEAIAATYAGEGQVLVFPAGLVSRKGAEGIRDLEWKKAFVRAAIRYRRDVVPVYFEALNRPRFYNIAYWRRKLGVKVNLEQALLPSELCASQGKKFRAVFGEPISWEDLAARTESPSAIAAEIKEKAYSLGR